MIHTYSDSDTYIQTHQNRYIHTLSHTHIHIYIHTQKKRYIQTDTCKQIHTHSYRHNRYIHRYIHTYVHTYIHGHTCRDTQTYTNRYLQTDKHRHTHTHTHRNKIRARLTKGLPSPLLTCPLLTLPQPPFCLAVSDIFRNQGAARVINGDYSEGVLTELKPGIFEDWRQVERFSCLGGDPSEGWWKSVPVLPFDNLKECFKWILWLGKKVYDWQPLGDSPWKRRRWSGAVTEEPLTVPGFSLLYQPLQAWQPGDSSSDNRQGGAALSSQEVRQHGFLSLGEWFVSWIPTYLGEAKAIFFSWQETQSDSTIYWFIEHLLCVKQGALCQVNGGSISSYENVAWSSENNMGETGVPGFESGVEGLTPNSAIYHIYSECLTYFHFENLISIY
jgi:hypothetical protein